MGSSAVEILRQQLRDKFPQAHGVRAEPEVIAPHDKPFHADTFPVGAISEVVPAGPVAGILLLVAGLLGEPEEASPQPELVLIDGADGFDPDSFDDAAAPAASPQLGTGTSERNEHPASTTPALKSGDEKANVCFKLK